MRVVARSSEDGVIEAVEGEGAFVVGVQWHPERTFETVEASKQLFADFVGAAGAWKLEAEKFDQQMWDAAQSILGLPLPDQCWKQACSLLALGV